MSLLRPENRFYVLLLSLPTPNTDQAWLESLFGHVKGEWPHLDAIDDPACSASSWSVCGLSTTRAVARSIGYVTTDDEHEGRGPAIRQARRDGWHAHASSASTTINAQLPESHRAD